MAITLDGTTGITAPGVTDTGNLSVTGTSTLTGAVSQTGSSTAASFIPTGSTVPANGVFLPSANTVAIATNSTNQVSISSAGIVTGTAGNLMLVQGTAQNTTSGTAIPFTSIPSWVKRVTLSFNGISTNGTSGLMVQLGSSAGYATGTYTGSATNGAGSVATSAFTTGHGLNGGPLAANAYYGTATFTLVSGNTWVGSSVLGATGTPQCAVGGSAIVLAATFDRIQLTTVNGTDTFDAGSINIQYE